MTSRHSRGPSLDIPDEMFGSTPFVRPDNDKTAASLLQRWTLDLPRLIVSNLAFAT